MLSAGGLRKPPAVAFATAGGKADLLKNDFLRRILSKLGVRSE